MFAKHPPLSRLAGSSPARPAKQIIMAISKFSFIKKGTAHTEQIPLVIFYISFLV